MNMDHVGTEVKKIRTPRYLEAGKKNFVHLEKSGVRNQRDPLLARFGPLLTRFSPASRPPKSTKGSPKAA
ncbi:hypothetical protein, partial [Paraburkholderia sp.]|uniref:hypothetical protein n=1 Tax=Paraburkholderia sp. TaxID=1926495 RepID=UPI002B4A7DA7